MSRMSETAYEAETLIVSLRASNRIAELETALREIINEVIPDGLKDSSPIVRAALDVLEKEW